LVGEWLGSPLPSGVSHGCTAWRTGWIGSGGWSVRVGLLIGPGCSGERRGSLMNVVRLLGSTVSFHVQTEHRADNRSSQNQKAKPKNRQFGSVSGRFGSVFGLNVPRLSCASCIRVGQWQTRQHCPIDAATRATVHHELPCPSPALISRHMIASTPPTNSKQIKNEAPSNRLL